MKIHASRSMTLTLWTLLAALMLTAVPVEAGDWQVRLRAINVAPDDSSSAVRSNGVDIPGTGVSVDDDTVPELDITYFFRPNWGLELILATSKHNVGAEGGLSGLGEIVEANVLPPTLLLQYHFAPDAKVRPYVGLGVNYTLFFDEDASVSFETAAGGATSVDLDESLGLAGQVGVDIGLAEDWFLNLDLKVIDLDTEATLRTPGPLGTVEVDVDINPVIFGVGVGRRF